MRTALLCCLIANVNRDTKKKPLPFKAEDFLLQFIPDEPQTEEQMIAMVKAITAAYGNNR
jgi:hypothetical protein